MNDQRPDPDRLLARVQQEETHKARGRLKVFFGSSAGVGKTYAMLQAGHDRRAEGIDVLIGYVETHGRTDTAAQVAGLELLPRMQLAYRSTFVDEFDVDAALARKPTLILVDELAHTNAEGARHPKRWQDVEELLNAGIDVYTTVNVQHLESLNDVVAQITGVIVRETVPDFVIEQADDIELIDLPPDELLQRLREGKVYRPQQAARAADNFFRKGNLIALRELALRRTADRVDAQMENYRRSHTITQSWVCAERLLVCIGPNPLSLRLVRAARRMAVALRAQWVVAYVETPHDLRLPESARDQINQTLRLAEQLGAETVTLSGPRVSEELLNYAHQRNASKIVIGKPIKPRWREFVFGSVVDEIVRGSGDIDVYVISGEHDDTTLPPPIVFERTSSLSSYGWAVAVVAVVTALAWLVAPLLDDVYPVLLYFAGVVLVASKFGRGPSIVASFLGVLCFNFFFVPPIFTLNVAEPQYLVTLAVMLLVALVISTLTVQTRQQMAAARQREQRTAALYAMSRELASLRGIDNLLQVAVRNTSATFDSRVIILLPVDKQRLQPWGSAAGWWGKGITEQMVFAPDANEQGVGQWVFDHGQQAGLGTDTLSGAQALYLPLNASRGVVGVLGVRPAQPRLLLRPDQLHLLETFANQVAVAIERAQLADEAQQAQVRAETERLRSSLLSSVSHDLRTPLATITGATSSLIDDASLDAAARRDLAQVAYEEAERLSRLVSNLLDVTRLESGALQVQKEWQPIEEVIGSTLNRLDRRLQGRPVITDIPATVPLVPIDSVLIELALSNLLENALKYTPASSQIDIRVQSSGGSVVVEVADHGPGLVPGDEQRIFEKFYRAKSGNGNSGVGLGLTIAKGVVEAHGGKMWAENRPHGGASFYFTLPVHGQPPQVEEPQIVAENTPTALLELPGRA